VLPASPTPPIAGHALLRLLPVRRHHHARLAGQFFIVLTNVVTLKQFLFKRIFNVPH
jgi:hypothetical protein